MTNDEFWRRQQQANEQERQRADRALDNQRREFEHREERAWERHWQAVRDKDKAQGGSAAGSHTSPVVLFFGLIGAFFFGVNPPWNFDWFFGAFFGFIVCGIGAVLLTKSAAGRTILWIVGLGFVALMTIAIMRA
ncbi:MAG: hypothetical protein AB7I04_09655 [Pseudomonadales bacterium]